MTGVTLPVVIPTLENAALETFDELDLMLKKSMVAETLTTMIAQACFSAIMLKDKWQEAHFWADRETGHLYMAPDEVPEGIDIIETDVPRFRTVEDWMLSLENAIGFSRSTCYMRHAEIVRQMELLNRPFQDAVKSVVLSPGHSRLILDRVVDANDMFVPQEVVKLLPPLMRDTALEEIKEGGAETCRQYILEQLEADDIRLEEGAHPRTIIADLKRSMGTYAQYTVSLSEKGNMFIIKQDKRGEIKKFYVMIECEDPRQRTPIEVVHWLADRMHVGY